MQYPDADLNPYLRKSTQFFREYIERGLKSVELERHDKEKVTAAQGQGEGQDVVLNVISILQ